MNFFKGGGGKQRSLKRWGDRRGQRCKGHKHSCTEGHTQPVVYWENTTSKFQDIMQECVVVGNHKKHTLAHLVITFGVNAGN